MNLRQIEAFRAVMTEGSVTQAAVALGVTQPAVSCLIANLEESMGFLLFKRHRGRFQPTGEAEIFLEDAERLLASHSRATRTARDIRDLKSGSLRVAALPAARVPYPMEEVDRAIYSLGGVAAEAPLPPATAALAEQGVFRDNLYPLFVAEFAAVLRGERDAAIREELQKLVRKTRFGAPGALAAFRAGLRAVLAGFPPDIAALGALAAGVFSREGPERTGKALAAALEATAFGFDRTTLARLRARGREDRRAAERELREVMTRRVEASAEAPGVALPNIYVACSLPTALVRPQCDGGRLRIPSAMFGSFTEILMSDILNPGKDATLAAMTTGIIEEHRFIIRPGEKILIRQAP